MGWKSTKILTRKQALAAITTEMAKVHEMTDKQLEYVMREMFGDDRDKPYFGHNFTIKD